MLPLMVVALFLPLSLAPIEEVSFRTDSEPIVTGSDKDKV